jgi:hypothetical protein
MINFVIAISNYAHKTKVVNDFGIFAQTTERVRDRIGQIDAIIGKLIVGNSITHHFFSDEDLSKHVELLVRALYQELKN